MFPCVREIFLARAAVTARGNGRHKQRVRSRARLRRGAARRERGQKRMTTPSSERLEVPALIYDLMQRARNVIFRRAARQCILNALALSDAAAATAAAESVIGVSVPRVTSARRVLRKHYSVVSLSLSLSPQIVSCLQRKCRTLRTR